MITGIVVALPEEISTLTAKKMTKGSCYFVTDTLLVAYSGAGSENAQGAAKQLLDKGATQLISWGCAAALSDQLKPGDLTLAASLVRADAQGEIESGVSSAWHQHCKRILTDVMAVHTGALLESKRIVSASSEKKHLFSETGAIALDMESIAVASMAKQKNIPFIAIRVIADPVSMDLPQAISAALNAQGDVVLSKLLGFLVLHPWELPGLIKLGLHFNAATKTLKTLARILDKITDVDQANAAAF
ncbi:MAG: phosphorylase [Methylococcales bacterium]|nr:phosphorylase [Methylococcales bacterium]